MLKLKKNKLSPPSITSVKALHTSLVTVTRSIFLNLKFKSETDDSMTEGGCMDSNRNNFDRNMHFDHFPLDFDRKSPSVFRFK